MAVRQGIIKSRCKTLHKTLLNMRNLLLLSIIALVLPVSCGAQADAEAEASEEETDTTNMVVKTIMERRSIRKYLDTPVEHEKLAQVVECGINAPNGMNKQPWEIRVVEDSAYISEVTEIFVKSNPDMAKNDPNFKNMFRNAPNIICVATPNGESSVDAGMLGENMMIAAQSMGLGTCCLGGPVAFLKSSEEAKPYLDKLELPEGYQLNYIIAIGYPDEKPEAKPRDASKVKYIK